MPDTYERLARLEQGQADIKAALAGVRERLDTLAGYAEDLMAEVGGVPGTAARGDRLTLRDRLHTLEDDRAAAKAVTHALEEGRMAHARAWGTWQKVGLFVFAGGAFVMGLLRVFGIGG